MSARFVVVTGASRGLGRSVAIELARSGFTVFAGVRRVEDAGELAASAPDGLRPIILDVASNDSIARAAAEVERATAGNGVAGLVNNAAAFLMGPFEQTPLEQVERLFRVNVLGLVATTQRFLPLLRLARGRIVNIGSLNGRLSVPFAAFYSASKFALEGLSDALRVELRPWGIGVSVVEPGATRTEIRRRGVEGWTESRAHLPSSDKALYEAAYARLRDLVAQSDPTAAGHEHVVRAVRDALTAEAPLTRYPTGPDAEQLLKIAALPDEERDALFVGMLQGSPAGSP